MYSLKGNGDNIAGEFFKIFEAKKSISKTAQELHAPEAAAEAEVDDSGVNGADIGLSDDALADMIVSPTEDQSDSNTDIQDQIDQMVDYADDEPKTASFNDVSGNYIMHGLGKIASSLRSKGEGFAADVVEATAFSIRGDLVKEANRKSSITSELLKLAREFDASGDSFAGDMVRATIENIGGPGARVTKTATVLPWSTEKLEAAAKKFGHDAEELAAAAVKASLMCSLEHGESRLNCMAKHVSEEMGIAIESAKELLQEFINYSKLPST